MTGNSMAPTLHHLADKVELVSPEVRAVKRGEIILFQRGTGECILRRVLRMDENKIVVNGDAQTWTETVLPCQVVGVVSRILRKDTWHSCNSLYYRTLVAIWRVLRPLRPTFFCVWGWFHKY